jgi:hypothetical protein
MLRVASDALEWARKVSWETLPMSSGGPRKLAGRLSRCPQVGPEIMLRNASDALEWAQKSKECFRFYWVGPEIMLRDASDCIGWAQKGSWEVFLFWLSGNDLI